MRISALVLLVALASACSKPERRPNVLLVSIDTLRPDHLGCYGYERATSPRIDALAREGVLFEQHVSSTSWTLPAHAALFTSLPDSLHGATDVDRKLADSAVTIAERFQSAGYSTAGFFSGPFLHPAFGLSQGFESYEDCTSYAARMDGRPASEWATSAEIGDASHRDVTNDHVVAAFERWFGARDEQPFFSFVHLWDVHSDFIPPPPYDRMFDPDYEGSVTGERFFFDASINARMPERDQQHLIALYDGEIAWTDAALGRILDLLARAGVLDDTIVVITADHGTEFFEHGDKGHRKTLYDEVIKIPLVVRFPRALPAGTRVRAQTSALDVVPTLVELAGLPAANDVFGTSLVGVARDPSRPHPELAISELFSVGRNVRAVRALQWKVHHDVARDLSMYFDLRADPGELAPSRERASQLGEVAERGRSAVETRMSSFARTHAVPAREKASATAPEGVRRQTDALGYTGSSEPEPK